MERNYKVYKHTSPSNKVYIGITGEKNVKKRWKNGKGYIKNKYFTNSIQKYGWDNFTHEILFDNLTKEEAKLMEQIYIALYDSTNREKGYNITNGGECSNGMKHTEETKKKIGLIHKGKIESEETRKKKSKSHKGKTFIMSNEGKKRISEAKKGKNPWENLTDEQKFNARKRISEANKGKVFTEEHKKRLSESKKGLLCGKNSPCSILRICITTGKSFYGVREASEYYNIDSSSITKCCKGKIKSCGKLQDGTKLVWKYLNGKYLLKFNHNKTYRIKNTENNQEAS